MWPRLAAALERYELIYIYLHISPLVSTSVSSATLELIPIKSVYGVSFWFSLLLIAFHCNLSPRQQPWLNQGGVKEIRPYWISEVLDFGLISIFPNRTQ